MERGGRRVQFVRKAKIWKHLKNYFPATLVKEAELPGKNNYIFGYHPHGIIATGLWVNFCTEANDVSEMFPGIEIHPVTLQGNLRIPFWYICVMYIY